MRCRQVRERSGQPWIWRVGWVREMVGGGKGRVLLERLWICNHLGGRLGGSLVFWG